MRIAVAGAGLIGKRHVEAIAETGEAQLACIIDPTNAASDYAAGLGVPWYSDLKAMITTGLPDGIILATPNQIHVEHGLECVAAGIPVLVEKPIASDVTSARSLVEAAEQAGVPLLVGHHRRYNPLIRATKEKLEHGAIGTIVSVHAMCWFFKPDDYFNVGWRRQPGAGPVFINLIHDIDLLRHLCGEVKTVIAFESNSVRGNSVEETAVILLRFENGALGTVNVSDTIVAPWSWELTASENPVYHPTGEACYLIGGTHGSFEIPNLAVWRNPAERSWWNPVERHAIAIGQEDPLVAQVRHFCRVIRGAEAPLVSGREGLNTLKVIEAVKQAAASGLPVRPARL